MTTKPNVITPQELAAIRERAEKATPGPWKLINYDNGFAVYASEVEMISDWYYENGFTEENAEFIANARTDIPRLLDEIERLQERWVYAIENAEHMADVLVPQDLSDFYRDVARYLRRIERESDAE
ncbi:ead/Ea22-like family protein [Brevibacillus borstelensis]|uniref:ead/Ea22-like family protein n=1 Tax=Brevibacillus borstelensis TaxID=45462 RepID=UPI00287FDDF8|nr:ead/Ea22-like family protein [Brevibacillus borstelensis]WNF07426.1 hypothetical protein RFB14_08465 [Brevibacillus borstelensis]